VGKRWVHQVHTYDTERGISYWTKNYRTSIESADEEALSREYVYYDPIYTLGETGQDWWREQSDVDATHALNAAQAKASREAAHAQSLDIVPSHAVHA
jgi:lysine 2,3-aminomutase